MEDSETLQRREDWVDTTLAVNQNGDRLMLRVDGRLQVDFAAVHFRGGQAQVVDFNEAPMEAGTYPLLDFKDGRHVDYVRVVARAPLVSLTAPRNVHLPYRPGVDLVDGVWASPPTPKVGS